MPIWKRERWQGGESWGLEPQHIAGVARLGGVDTDAARALSVGAPQEAAQ